MEKSFLINIIFRNFLTFVYTTFLICFQMERDNRNKSFFIWIEEIWEEIEIQFYRIIGAIFFFLIYFIFQPLWMRPLDSSFF